MRRAAQTLFPVNGRVYNVWSQECRYPNEYDVLLVALLSRARGLWVTHLVRGIKHDDPDLRSGELASDLDPVKTLSDEPAGNSVRKDVTQRYMSKGTIEGEIKMRRRRACAELVKHILTKHRNLRDLCKRSGQQQVIPWPIALPVFYLPDRLDYIA